MFLMQMNGDDLASAGRRLKPELLPCCDVGLIQAAPSARVETFQLRLHLTLSVSGIFHSDL